MELNRLHHVGIVMNEPERVERFMQVFGLMEDYREYVPEYHAMCIFTKLDGTSLELIVPDGGVLKEYNGGKGGLHHIAFCVEDAGPILVNFLRPRAGAGILVEFVETTGA